MRVDLRVAAGAVGLVVLAACGGSSPQPAPPPPPKAASPSPTHTPSDTDQILSQYTAFWSALTPASVAPPGARRVLLAKYATAPLLDTILASMTVQDKSDEQSYGAEVLHPKILQVGDNYARVGDCQDSRSSGRKRRSGQILTKGVAQNPVTTTMTKSGGDRVWRATAMTFGGDYC